MVVDGNELRMMDMELSMMLLRSVQRPGWNEGYCYSRAVVDDIAIAELVDMMEKPSAEIQRNAVGNNSTV